MSKNDFFEFNLSSDNKSQSLQLSLYDNRISIILENKSDPNEKYTALIELSQLAEICEAFQNINSLKEALILLADTVEAGNIYLTVEKDQIDLKLSIQTEKEKYPPFIIQLLLENQNIEETPERVQEAPKEEFETLPAKFDYQGNIEAEEKYGKSTQNTTEFNKPIIKSDYKQPIVQLEYIEPILQVHYPDGTTKSKALPPRIQTVDGKTPDINEEQFRYIREQMNRSVGSAGQGDNKTKSQYSTTSVPVPSFDNIFGAITASYNSGENSDKNNIQTYEPQIPTQSQYQTQNEYNKPLSTYSTRTMVNKPKYSEPQDIYTKDKVKSRSPPRYKTIEYAPRMINQSQNNNITNFNINQSQAQYNYNTNTSQINKSNIYNQYQNAISKSQIPSKGKKPFSTSSKNFKGFAQVIPLKQIKRPPQKPKPIPQPQITPDQYPQYSQYVPESNVPFEFSTEQQKERFQTQLKIQQAIVDSKTPTFPSVLPTQIMETKYEFPQGKDYEEKLMSKIKAEDHEWDPSLYNQNTQYTQYEQSQSIQSQVLPIIYQQGNQLENNTFNEQMEQQLQNYNEENINKMNDMKVINNEEEAQKEEVLGNNEVIDDNENNENNEEANQEENNEEDIEALYKTEEGYIIFRNGLLRGIIHRYSEIDEIISKIQDKLLKGAKFNLLYKAFSDGDKASIFHQKCDKHPITMVLIETSEGVRFGGFTKESWEGKNLKKKDNDAFVFSLDTGKIFEVKKDEPAIGCYPKFGPVFFGCQIRIYDKFFTKESTTCLKGLNYNTTKDYELNNGQRNFVIKDMEVYEIETIDV